jgi:hypothetical protein
MQKLRFTFGAVLVTTAVLGTLALLLPPASAEAPDFCPKPPGPPGTDCRACPTYVDPVVCTVICAGGPKQKTFSNQCFASCSGYIIVGECVKIGG